MKCVPYPQHNRSCLWAAEADSQTIQGASPPYRPLQLNALHRRLGKGKHCPVTIGGKYETFGGARDERDHQNTKPGAEVNLHISITTIRLGVGCIALKVGTLN